MSKRDKENKKQHSNVLSPWYRTLPGLDGARSSVCSENRQPNNNRRGPRCWKSLYCFKQTMACCLSPQPTLPIPSLPPDRHPPGRDLAHTGAAGLCVWCLITRRPSGLPRPGTSRRQPLVSTLDTTRVDRVASQPASQPAAWPMPTRLLFLPSATKLVKGVSPVIHLPICCAMHPSARIATWLAVFQRRDVCLLSLFTAPGR